MRTEPVCLICPFSANRDASIDPTAANPGARCSETEIEGDLLTRESGPQAACPEPVEGSRSPRWILRHRSGQALAVRKMQAAGWQPWRSGHFPARRFMPLISVVAVPERHLKPWW